MRCISQGDQAGQQIAVGSLHGMENFLVFIDRFAKVLPHVDPGVEQHRRRQRRPAATHAGDDERLARPGWPGRTRSENDTLIDEFIGIHATGALCFPNLLRRTGAPAVRVVR